MCGMLRDDQRFCDGVFQTKVFAASLHLASDDVLRSGYMYSIPVGWTDGATFHVDMELSSCDSPLLLVSDGVFRNVCPSSLRASNVEKHAVEVAHGDGGNAVFLLQLPCDAEWQAVWNRVRIFDNLVAGLFHLGGGDSPCAGCWPVSAFIMDSSIVLGVDINCLYGECLLDCVPSSSIQYKD